MKRTILAAAALLAAAGPAAAQQAGAPAALSLEDAFRLAGENNPAYRKAVADVGTTEADRRRARGAFLPTLGLSVRTTGDYTRTFTGRDELGQPVVRDEAIESKTSYITQGVEVGGLTLFDGGARMRELRAANAADEGARARVSAEALRVRGEVARRYFKAVQAQRTIVLEEALLAQARERVELTRRLMRVAVRTPVDVLGTEVKVAEQEQAVEKARGDLRKAVLELRQEMGVLEGGELALTDEPPAVFDPSGLDAAALVAAAVEGNPRLERVAAGESAARHRLRAAQSARWPTVTASAGVGRSQYFEGYDGLVELNPINQGLNFGLTVSFPIFNQFRTSYQIAQARATLSGAQEDARAERLAVETDVHAALIDLQNAYTAARNAERTLGLNRERLALAQEQYRTGALGFADLQDAVESASRAERDALRTRFEFAAALATLEEKVGRPVTAAGTAAAGTAAATTTTARP